MIAANIIRELVETGEDFEWYPTTQEIIDAVASDIACADYRSTPESILDVGAGDGRVLVGIKERLNRHIDLFAIEKATVHLANMPKEISVIGTDFLQQTLVDKPMGCVFCNPPYSEYVEWMLRIIREASTQYVYLVVPQRWRDVVAVEHALKSRSAKVTTLGQYDFLDADRKARAKVEVLRITFSWSDQDAFDSVVEGMLPELDVFDRDADLEDQPEETLNAVIKGSGDTIESMVMAYEAELMKLIDNYRNALKIDIAVLRELGVSKESILKGIRCRIKGLKDKYWKALFEELAEVRNRMATKQRAQFLKSLADKVTIDFTEDNVAAMLLWVSKWANNFYDEQLIDLFRTLSTDSNVIKYKSNQRVWTQGDWYYQRDEDNRASHYRLEYRLVITHGGICTSEYNWRRGEHRGLAENAWNLLRDIVTVANNLGFECDDTPGRFEWESNKQNRLRLKNGEVLVAVRAFKNGNMHLHFNPRVMLAINVEAGRLLGWIRNPAEACAEFETSESESKDVHAMFGSVFRVAAPSQFKLTFQGWLKSGRQT